MKLHVYMFHVISPNFVNLIRSKSHLNSKMGFISSKRILIAFAENHLHRLRLGVVVPPTFRCHCPLMISSGWEHPPRILRTTKSITMKCLPDVDTHMEHKIKRNVDIIMSVNDRSKYAKIRFLEGNF